MAVLEAAVERLTADLGTAVSRLSALEARVGESASLAAPAIPTAATLNPPIPPMVESVAEIPPELAIPDRHTLLRFVTLGGRSLMVLGGAYLLRAVTDAGTVTPAIGVALGLLYAAAGLWLGHRAGEAGHPRSAAFHGLTATAIAFPLIWEATGRLAVLPTPLAAALLIAFFAGGFAVAGRYSLYLLAWATAVLGGGAAIGLLFRTHATSTFGIALLALGAVALHATYRRDWRLLRWLATLAVDGTLLVLLVLAARNGPPEWLPSATALTLLLAFAALYVALLARRTLGAEAKVGVFEVFQMVVAVAVGIGGAARLATGVFAWVLGGVVLALAVAAYACAFRSQPPERDPRPGLLLYASLGAVLALVALRLLLPPMGALLAVGLLALTAAWLGISLRRRLLEAQAAFFAFVLAVQSGLLRQAVDALFAPADHDWVRVSAPGLLALAVAIAGRGILLRRPADDSDRWVRWASNFARLVLTALLLTAIGAVVCELLAGALAAAPGPAADRGALAALRTTILGLAAVVLALLGRLPRLREAAWLVYPTLAVGGLKFFVDDLPNGRAGTLFISLLVLGGALLAVSRLGAAEPGSPGPPTG
ncbi:MAG: hypothetical protein KA788_13790 [Lacunisphaera sp.]|nr:hypothetical protein [Lacunisphaera sp.]